MIQSLPEDVTIDDSMAELYFKLQVDTGLRELDEGKGIPQDETPYCSRQGMPGKNT